MHMCTRLKICGITRLEDALLASEYGADAIGFVFYDKSPRYIHPENAEEIIQSLPPFMTVVGLFVNPTQENIDDVLAVCSLDILQLHGDESADFCSAQKRRVIKALPVSEPKDLTRIAAYDCAVLLDAKAPLGIYGGTGNSFDWNMLSGIQHHAPLILAGGIDLNNVTEAKQIQGFYALDVSSGVEVAKGIKDRKKLKELCEKFCD
ncbi:phosphoribosylanthranilate isomerase [Ghiorsea bivora]|uniref:phosphoribosylanthranilate isomerase n=1 Tax=Ghiorsea bivora TaxID=1485545 RepID=UPI0009DCFB63|nr:phosphoribosylanthranilate isomerase [Ghiorsea bivora]